ncbi:5-formyltetrahydrofolate cyclo-ligase [Paenibacillus ginsengarvi]|uniref:5-formyltetrahydrofolate cyclo-ligase n=1 Tax=Paenibacillus ginsengarvi TaxID=400777 RepID=A0A3B0C8E6_9BACL|nr:5-formyltetrahydrofolate cyclo-ligase [Paenibacillus ginsengarvi]RKN82203.1 5-formyltetrahydrofolate cyclo-ligase [Paenibacillus ginsengarvi]
MTAKALKTELRKQAEAARAALSVEDRALYSAQACYEAIRYLDTLFPALGNDTFTLFSYVPFRTELDVTPIMQWCWQRGGRVAVPKVIADRKLMSLHLIGGLDELVTGKWGIREPEMSAPIVSDLSAIDVMLVPGLAFDGEGGRLGYGGGYYDAFIRRCRENAGKEPYKLAVAFDVQRVAAVPMDDHDFRVDAVVTEKHKWLVTTGNKDARI